MKKSESISEIAKALSECQSELQDVYKGTKGYGYNYAPLDKVYDEVRPKMTKHGLSLTHQKSYNRDNNIIELHSMLMHVSGEWIEYYGSLPFSGMKQMNDYQSSGSGFTYLERYQTSAIFGITADEDQDAQGEQEVKQEPKQYKTQSKSTDEEKKEYKKQFMSVLKSQDVDDVLDFFNFLGVDHTNEKETSTTVMKFLRQSDHLYTQIESYKIYKHKQISA